MSRVREEARIHGTREGVAARAGGDRAGDHERRRDPRRHVLRADDAAGDVRLQHRLHGRGRHPARHVRRAHDHGPRRGRAARRPRLVAVDGAAAAATRCASTPSRRTSRSPNTRDRVRRPRAAGLVRARQAPAAVARDPRPVRAARQRGDAAADAGRSAWSRTTRRSWRGSRTSRASPRRRRATCSPPWSGLGYNRRALALQAAARVVAERGWPDDLTALPGVGPYTAAAVGSFAWDRQEAAVDTNVRRVSSATTAVARGPAALAARARGAAARAGRRLQPGDDGARRHRLPAARAALQRVPGAPRLRRAARSRRRRAPAPRFEDTDRWARGRVVAALVDGRAACRRASASSASGRARARRADQPGAEGRAAAAVRRRLSGASSLVYPQQSWIETRSSAATSPWAAAAMTRPLSTRTCARGRRDRDAAREPAPPARRPRRAPDVRAGPRDPRGGRDRAAELRAQAGRDAGEHVARVETATGGMLARLNELEGELTTCSTRCAAAASGSTRGSPSCSARSATSAARRTRAAGRRAGRARAPPSTHRRQRRRGDEAGARLIALNMALSGYARARRPRLPRRALRPRRPRGAARRRVLAGGPVNDQLVALRRHMAERVRSLLRRRPAVLGPAHGDAARRRRAPRRGGSATLARVIHARETRPSSGADRRARAVGGRAGPGLRRRAADLVEPARLREGGPRAGGPGGRDDRAKALGQQAWIEARAANSFAPFRDALAQQVELRHRYVACFEGFAHPYDALLDDFEPGLTVAELRPLFAELRDALVPIVAAAGDPEQERNDGAFYGEFPTPRHQRIAVSTCSRRSASIPTPGGSTRRCTRSPPASRPTTCGSRPLRRARLLGRAVLGAARVRARALRGAGRAGTCCARRSTTRSRSACTSRRAGCGRTSSAARARSAPGCSRACARSRRPRRARPDDAVPCAQHRAAVARPHRGRRDDLQPPHHPALRARARPGRGLARDRRRPGRRGTRAPSGCSA